ncbi:restriction endonuclease [Caldisericum sp. AR60]|uniref:restriction endonuclease n=1 Tax=Caldisericum sp. AR60 TaxID=3397852 RepID=UPI0039FD0A40
MIPKFHKLMKPMLQFLQDQKDHTIDEVEDYLANLFKLTNEERNELLPSGKQRVFKNRVYWARTYLNKAKLVDVPKRGSIVITDRGLKVLKDNPSEIDVKYLTKFNEFVEFYKGYKKEKSTEIDIQEATPEEVIFQKIEELNSIIKSDLRKRIMEASPRFFERLILDLIVSMGYGGSFEEASKLLGKSGDEGIDGVIKEDVLGLDKIYLQAKRWDNSTIGRKEIQAFVGALHGKVAKKGIFITTSTFTKDALKYAEKISDMKVVLIDGDRLLDYMLKYNVGVEQKTTIEIKKVNEDYFEEY